MNIGTITRWFENRGFGFITPDGATESFFLHINSISPVPFDPPQSGDRYSFTVKTGLDGRPRAVEASLITAEQEEAARVFG